MEEQGLQELCCFATCGSVDDGKSTLIGRLLFECDAIYSDVLDSLERTSKKFGTTGEIDFALLVDGLQSEREQGITIDVAYRFFRSKKRKFIIADCPGHEQYTKNMISGVSHANIALILVDVTKGVGIQTRRHSYLVGLLGIREVIVAINKMDLVGYDFERFLAVKSAYEEMAASLPNAKEMSFSFVPISALRGDNITTKSNHIPATPLLTLLENATLFPRGGGAEPFYLPVQYINRDQNFRGYCGNIASGEIALGDEIFIYPSGQKSTIKSIYSTELAKEDQKEASQSLTKPLGKQDQILYKDLKNHQSQKSQNQTQKKEITQNQKPFALAPLCVAGERMAVMLELEHEISISRGDVMSTCANPKLACQFAVVLMWMAQSPLECDCSYLFMRSSTTISGRINNLVLIDMQTFENKPVSCLAQNGIAKAELLLDGEMMYCSYYENMTLGSFIIIDKYSHATVGAGLICHEQTQVTPASKYTENERALNAFIRLHYPEWGCKQI